MLADVYNTFYIHRHLQSRHEMRLLRARSETVWSLVVA
jgi:hypothetical protein